MTALIAIGLLHVGVAIYEEETKPSELCGACLRMAATPGLRVTICSCIPFNRSCPTCGREWRTNAPCLLRTLAESLADLFR